MSVIVKGSQIKSIQRGVISCDNNTGSGTATATITAVNTTKAKLIHGGISGDGTTTGANQFIEASLRLTNATTVTAKTAGNGLVCEIPFQVVEYS